MFPNDFLKLSLVKNNSLDDNVVALEPRSTSKVYACSDWPSARLVNVIDNEIRIVNNTKYPIHVPKNEHLCQVRATYVVDPPKVSTKSSLIRSPPVVLPPYSKPINLDKQLNDEWRQKFQNLHLKMDSVFHPNIGRYNGKSGHLKMKINFGSANPPVRKLHAPNYGKNNLDTLQDQFDDLEGQGAFGRPEDIGVTVEHVSPSFLVHKDSGGFRLVTAFTTLAEYVKTLPAVMPIVETMLITIAEWKYVIMTDLKDAFYQIPLSKESMKWCATSTPYKANSHPVPFISIHIDLGIGLMDKWHWHCPRQIKEENTVIYSFSLFSRCT